MSMNEFMDQLPGVLREADERDRFLARFVGALEEVFDTVQTEIEQTPRLYALPPTSVLTHVASIGESVLRLDSAAGLCADDLLVLDPPEVVRVAGVVGQAPVPPTDVRLDRPLRFAHDKGIPIRVVDRTEGTSALAVAAPPETTTVSVADQLALAARPGHVVEVGGDLALVTAVDAARLTLSPPLPSGHPAGTLVTAAPQAPTTTPPPAFASAVRAGPEMLLRNEVLAGERVIELDTYAALGPGSRLLLCDPAHAETVVVDGFLPGPRRGLRLTAPLAFPHPHGTSVAEADTTPGGTAFLGWLAGWIGLELRPTRGERWNRELLRRAGAIWSWRGTRPGLAAFLEAYLRDEALPEVVDHPDPMQIGVTSTLGEDTYVCGARPGFFWVELTTVEGDSRLRHPLGLAELVLAAHDALRRERPAHTTYELRVNAHTMQLGKDPEVDVGARVGDTTLLWDQPMSVQNRL
ncbi:hypothetical protein ACYSUO_10110 [Streptomyces sp. UC4497]